LPQNKMGRENTRRWAAIKGVGAVIKTQDQGLLANGQNGLC
jgi:hypothetical protein